MVQTVQAKDINLRYFIDNFGLELVLNDQFFWEWQDNLLKVQISINNF
jgi:hypothetical protein